MSDVATLAHDVGKYVARIARNVKAGAPVPAPLIPMLIRDLYELPSGKRASARFDELAASLSHDERLVRARELLAEIDLLEARVREREDDACSRACALALEVEALIRGASR